MGQSNEREAEAKAPDEEATSRQPFTSDFLSAARLELLSSNGGLADSRAGAKLALQDVADKLRHLKSGSSVKDNVALSTLFEDCVTVFWSLLSPNKEPDWPETWRLAFLQESESVKVLASIINFGVEAKVILREGGALASAAVEGLREAAKVSEPVWERILPAFDYFVREFLGKRCRVKDPVGLCRYPARLTSSLMRDYQSPLGACALYDFSLMIRFLRETFKVDLDEEEGQLARSPLWMAFMKENKESFSTLLELGANPKAKARFDRQGNAVSAPYRMPMILVCAGGAGTPSRNELLDLCFKKVPGLEEVSCYTPDEDGEDRMMTLLSSALSSGKMDVVKLLLDNKVVTLAGSSKVQEVNASSYIFYADSNIFEMMCKDYGLFSDDWKRRCGVNVLDAYTDGFGRICRLSVAEGNEESGRNALRNVKTALKYGFNRNVESNGLNLLLAPFAELPEEATIATYRMLRDAGCDIKCGVDGAGFTRGPAELSHWAAVSGLRKILKFAIEELGCSVNAVCELDLTRQAVTPLSCAFITRRTPVALSLLKDYKAAICLEGLKIQPLFLLLEKYPRTPIATRDILSAAARNDPHFLDLKYATTDSTGTCINHIAAAVMAQNHAALDFFLTTPELTGVGEAVEHYAHFPAPINAVGTAAQLAGHLGDWQALSLLLKNDRCKVTTKYTGPVTGRRLALPSVEELCRRSCPDRLLKGLVEAAAKKEKEEAKVKPPAASSAASSTAPSALSNAPEHPGIKVVLTEKEEKAKAKKRAQKKKAKEKKRAAAAAAGAGGAGGGAALEPDSDSSDEPDEDEGLDEEERMLARAPTFDLEKERASRKARAEAEASSKADTTGSTGTASIDSADKRK
jgi:hypothetical protein